MAASPDWKVYLGKEYRAACKRVEDAAAFVAFLGDGAEIRFGHARALILWTEGKETQPAAESYDFVAETTHARLRAFREKRNAAQVSQTEAVVARVRAMRWRST